MKWTIYNAYGAWFADNGVGNTIWALSEHELLSCLNLF